MEPHLHRRRVRQLLTVSAVLLALVTLTTRWFIYNGYLSEPVFQLIGFLGWIVVILGLLSLAVSFGREAQKWLQEREVADA